MKIVIPIITFLLGALLVLLLIGRQTADIPLSHARMELIHARRAVEKRLRQHGESLTQRLKGFAGAVGEDRDFAMKLIAEQERSASEVSDFAQRYIEPMDISVLEITDSAYMLLSCGQFPAAAGNSVAEKAQALGPEGTMLVDEIRGKPVLTLQAIERLSIADQTLHCIGGLTVNRAFVEALSPRPGVRLLLKWEEEIIGGTDIESMSDLEGNTIIVNDTTYLATSASLPWAGEGEAPELLILTDKPPRRALIPFF